MYEDLVSQIFCCQADGSERPSKTQKVDTGVNKGDEAKLQFVMNGIAKECTFSPKLVTKNSAVSKRTVKEAK